MLLAKNISEFSPERFAFGLESGRVKGDGLRAGTEKWEDVNTDNGDGSKGRWPDQQQANINIFTIVKPCREKIIRFFW